MWGLRIQQGDCQLRILNIHRINIGLQSRNNKRISTYIFLKLMTFYYWKSNIQEHQGMIIFAEMLWKNNPNLILSDFFKFLQCNFDPAWQIQIFNFVFVEMKPHCGLCVLIFSPPTQHRITKSTERSVVAQQIATSKSGQISHYFPIVSMQPP